MRRRMLGAAAACGLALTAFPPAAHAAASCGGTAPLQDSCSTFGWLPSAGTFSTGCRSTSAYTGVVYVTVTTESGAALTFTCYLVAGAAGTRTEPLRAGTFYAGDSYWLDGQALGAGGWEVYVTP